MSNTLQVIDSSHGCPEIPIVEGDGNAKVVVWPGSGARYRTFQIVTLGGGSGTIPLRHAADAAYYVMGGSGTIADLGTGSTLDLAEGAMVHIDASDRYQFRAGNAGLKVLGGPCPADEGLYTGLAPGGRD